MAAVVSGLGRAGGGAGGRGIALALAKRKIFVAHVGIFALSVEGGIDCSPELGWAAVTGNCRGWGGLVVPYRIEVSFTRT